MMKKYFCLFCAGVLMSGTSIYAQELTPDTIRAIRNYGIKDNWTIGAQVGINYPMAECNRSYSITSQIGPSAQIFVGKFFNPVLGTRLTIGYNRLTGAIGESSVKNTITNTKYHYNNVNAYIDGMLSFTNLFSKFKNNRKLDVIGILGVGYNSFFGYDNYVDSWYLETGNRTTKYNTTGHHCLSPRLGLQFAIKMSEALDLSVEGDWTYADDNSNALYIAREYDMITTLTLGVTYHFKDQFGDRRMKCDYYNDADKVAALNDEVNHKREELVEASKEIVKDEQVVENSKDDCTLNIHYLCNDYKVDKCQNSQVANVAKFLKENPDKKIKIIGYADSKTGVPVYNEYIAQRRADYVKKMLVKGYKINANRIITESKGDTVQPYENENDWNRVVIMSFED